jgi:hypothetical protein
MYLKAPKSPSKENNTSHYNLLSNSPVRLRAYVRGLSCVLCSDLKVKKVVPQLYTIRVTLHSLNAFCESSWGKPEEEVPAVSVGLKQAVQLSSK